MPGRSLGFYLPTRKDRVTSSHHRLCCADRPGPGQVSPWQPVGLGQWLNAASRLPGLQTPGLTLDARGWLLQGGRLPVRADPPADQSGPVPSMAPIGWPVLQASRRGRCARVLVSAERHDRSPAPVCRRFCQGATGVGELSTVVGLKVPASGRWPSRQRSVVEKAAAPLLSLTPGPLQRRPQEGPECQPGGERAHSPTRRNLGGGRCNGRL